MEKRIARLDKYIIYKGLNDNKITTECGLSNGLLGNARRGNVDLGTKAIEKILNKYGDLNRVWLLTGEGQMLNNSPNFGNVVNSNGDGNFFDQPKEDCSELMELLKKKDQQIDRLLTIIEHQNGINNQ